MFTLTKFRAQGLTEEMWEQWREDPIGTGTKINPKYTKVALPDTDGHKMVLIKMQTPFMITNRSIVTCIYESETADGFKVLTHSSQGNEEIVAAQASEIGSDVVANDEITQHRWKAFDGGLEVWLVSKMDPAGSLPGFLKNKLAARKVNSLAYLVEFLQSGSKPEPLF